MVTEITAEVTEMLASGWTEAQIEAISKISFQGRQWCAWNNRAEDRFYATYRAFKARQTTPATPSTPPVEAATPKQIDFIMSLIGRGAHKEGGYFSGPTTRTEVAKLTKRQASQYIDSLKGGY